MDERRRPRIRNDRFVKRLAAARGKLFLGAKTMTNSCTEARQAVVATTRDLDMGVLSTYEALLARS
jgi:hypothetical protein